MNLILALCVDDHMGLMFNNRRQSRDSAVISDIMSCGSRVWLHPRSVRLFAGQDVLTDEGYLSKAGSGEWCFCEDKEYLSHAERIEKIVLYRWNRVYPKDVTFEFPGQWRLARAEDFPGTSHEKITREEYVK